VLELGAGTALPGLLCAKVGAKKVYLSDEAEQGNTIKNISEAVSLNSLQEKVDKALL
jgi:predicted nicotinamide N-methyase